MRPCVFNGQSNAFDVRIAYRCDYIGVLWNPVELDATEPHGVVAIFDIVGAIAIGFPCRAICLITGLLAAGRPRGNVIREAIRSVWKLGLISAWPKAVQGFGILRKHSPHP